MTLTKPILLTIGLPIKSYLKRYVLQKQHLPFNRGRVNLMDPGDIPFLLRTLLEGKTIKLRPDWKEPTLENFDDLLILEIPKTHMKWGKIVMSEESIIFANAFLTKNFHEFLVERVLMAREYGISEQEVINKISKQLEIEDMISFDALKKASYRLRKNKKLPIF